MLARLLYLLKARDSILSLPPAVIAGVDMGALLPDAAGHGKKDCGAGPCPLHSPTNHALRDALQYHGSLSGLTVRRCVHDVLHPDVDDAGWPPARHDCDGCCGVAAVSP